MSTPQSKKHSNNRIGTTNPVFNTKPANNKKTAPKKFKRKDGFGRRSHTSAPSKLWRFFKTRTKTADGKQYVYETKHKFQSLVARAQFWEYHGRYQDLVNPTVV